MGAKIQNATPPPVFIRSEPNFMINKVVMGNKNLWYVLAMTKFKILWHFEILAWESMGKS